jgi:hypothetical protein
MLHPFLACAAMKNVPPLLVAVLAILVVGMGVSASQVTFAFHPQQSVYIVAVRGRSGYPWMSTLGSSTWRHDLPVEKEIRKGFEKRGVFKIASSPLTADFVFLCITDYYKDSSTVLLDGVFAVALKPGDFMKSHSELARMLGPERVLDFALWQKTRLASLRVKLKSVMNDFHDFALKK